MISSSKIEANKQRSLFHGAGVLRTKAHMYTQFLLELTIAKRDWKILLVGVVWQWVHSVATNLVYYMSDKYLSAAQREPLYDIVYELLPAIDGAWWGTSEVFIYTMIGLTSIMMLSVVAVDWRPPHGRALYFSLVFRRVMLCIVPLLTLRCVSFLTTVLPGASRQCLYSANATEDHYWSESAGATPVFDGVADPSGNPEEWDPPTTLSDILFRMDATNGCGDLMFSSHTIFSMMTVCLAFRYFNWRAYTALFVCLQTGIIPFILASHKHYSVDVFTSLYVVPMMFELVWVKLPDPETSEEMRERYGLRFSAEALTVTFADGKTYSVSPSQLPANLSADYQRPAGYDSSRPNSKDGSINGALGDVERALRSSGQLQYEPPVVPSQGHVRHHTSTDMNGLDGPVHAVVACSTLPHSASLEDVDPVAAGGGVPSSGPSSSRPGSRSRGRREAGGEGSSDSVV